LLSRRGVLKKRQRTRPVIMRGPVWGGRQAAGKADSQAFCGKRPPHRWLGSSVTKPVKTFTLSTPFRLSLLVLQCCLRGRHTRGRWARRGLYTYGRSMAKAMDVFNLATTRAGRSSRLIGRGGGRCCRAARHRRLSNSRPRPRCPCSYPTPSCAPGVLCGGAH